MDQKPPVRNLRVLARKVALKKAADLSDQRAYEIWRAIKLSGTKESLEGLPGAIVQVIFQTRGKSLQKKHSPTSESPASGSADRWPMWDAYSNWADPSSLCPAFVFESAQQDNIVQSTAVARLITSATPSRRETNSGDPGGRHRDHQLAADHRHVGRERGQQHRTAARRAVLSLIALRGAAGRIAHNGTDEIDRLKIAFFGMPANIAYTAAYMGRVGHKTKNQETSETLVPTGSPTWARTRDTRINSRS